MLRVCAGLRLWRNPGGPRQSPLWILRGFSAQFLAQTQFNERLHDQQATSHSLSSVIFNPQISY